MSGTETLVPYLKEKEKGEQPTVIVDSREASTAPKIVKGLKEMGAEVRIEILQKGDYIISDLCAFERKSLTGDTPILVLIDGNATLTTVEKVWEQYINGAIIEALTITPDLRCGWAYVSKVIRHESENLMEVITERGRHFVVTRDHNLFTMTTDGHITSVPTDQLERGDIILYPRRVPAINEYLAIIDVSERLKGKRLSLCRSANLKKIVISERVRLTKTLSELRDKIPINMISKLKVKARKGSDRWGTPLKFPFNESFAGILGYIAA